jgi:hypothetical protein
MLEYWSVNELILNRYVLVNKSIEDLVKVNFGDDKWEAVKTRSGVGYFSSAACV